MRGTYVLCALFAVALAGCAVESEPQPESVVETNADGTSTVTVKEINRGGGETCPNSGPGAYVYECPVGSSCCVSACSSATCKDTCYTGCGCKLVSSSPGATQTISTTTPPVQRWYRAAPVGTLKLAP
jgi:hypothetical protein